MSTIVTRSGKGSALTHTEMDANFTNLNNDKLQTPHTGSIAINNTTTSDSVTITTTEDSSNAAPVFTMKRNSASPADGDYLGQLKFQGENDADQEVVYAKITAKISDATDGTEDGLLEFANRKAGSNNIGMRLTSTDLKLLNGTGLELGGALDVNGQSIVSASNGNIAITPDGTGKVILDGISYPTADGSANQVIKTDGSGNLSFVNASGFSGDLAGDTLTDSTQGVTIDSSSSNKLKFENTDGNPGSVLFNTFAFSSGGTMFIPAALEFRTPADKRLYKLEARGSADDGTHDAYMYITGGANRILSKNEANNAYVSLDIRASEIKIYDDDNYRYSLPQADGTANQIIKTNGSGVLSFTDASGFDGDLAGNDLTDSTQDITIKPTGSTQAELKLLDTGNDSMKLQMIGINTDAVGGQIDAIDQTGARANITFTGKQIDFDGNGGSLRFKTNAAAEKVEFSLAGGAASTDTLTVESTGFGQINVTADTNVSFGTSTKKLSFPGGVSRADVNVMFEFASFTTTARDAIGTPNNGSVLYNTSTNKLQVYANGAWVDLH